MGAAVEDLELSVRRDGDALAVRVAASPAGTTFEQRTSVADLDRLLALDGGHDAVTRDIGGMGPSTTPGPLIGETLFRAVFRDAVGDRFRVSCDRAAASGAALRLVLTLDSAADALPWELLADPEAGRPLALRHPIVRSLPGADDPRPPIEGPLRVLAVVATPVGTAPLDTAAELRRVRDALRRFVESRAIDLSVVTATSFGDLARALEDGPWHVVHYVGHGTRQPDGTGALVLHDDATGHDVVTGAALGAALTATGDVRLVVLNACHTATPDQSDPFAGTASALVRAGVPTVVAMRRAITDGAAVAFAGALYAGLVGGSTVEAAVTSARRVLYGSQRSGTEWATPVVCTRLRGRAVPILPHTDDDVRFTVARPAGLRATQWETMLVLAHRSGPYVGARGETVDPGAQVEARIQTMFGADAPTAQRTTVTSAGAIPRGTELVVAVEVPGVETIVRDSPATWRGDLAEVLVQLRAPAGLVGQSVEGWVRVFSGPLLLAEAAVEFAVVADGAAVPPDRAPEPMRRFRRIFPCFSPADAELVRGLAATAAAMGDVEYVAGVFDDDAQAPDQWMVTALRDADVFQLFWSTSSMTSERCRRQWQAAVALDRPDFVRPLYWERPMPRAPDLPPPELDGLRFVAIPIAAEPAAAPANPPIGRRANRDILVAPPAQPAASRPGTVEPVEPLGAPAQRTIEAEAPCPAVPTAPAGARTSPGLPAAREPATARSTRSRASALAGAALVLLGGLVGLVVGGQSTVPQGVRPGTGSTSDRLPALLVGLACGALAALALIAWRHRHRHRHRHPRSPGVIVIVIERSESASKATGREPPLWEHHPRMSDERRMSDAEGLMWRVDKDPHLSSTFGTVSVLDRPPDFDALRARMEQATWAVPRLRWRVQPAPVNLSAPTWVDDPDFDIDNHVRRIALPKPGSMRQLLDLASLFTNDALDRTRPLWQFVVIEGLRGGKAALVQKMHHTITDGEGGVQMSLQFLDFDRDPPPRPPVDPSSADITPPPPPQTAAETMRDLVAGGFRLPLGVARQVGELLADPTAIPAASAATVDTIRGVLQQLSDVERARSPLWTDRSLRRHCEVVRAPFRATKDAAKRLGGTLNTAFITAAAEAAARYHDDLGAPVEHLRTTMAVSTRTSAADRNAFTLARMMVPTSPMPIAERFGLIQAIADQARGGSGGASLQTLAAVAAALPTSLVTRLARQQAQTVDFATSNVKAAPVPVYIAGARLLENYPLGPLAGVAFNLTLLSYAGSLDMGINIDAAAVAEPELLAKHLDAAFADLVGE